MILLGRELLAKKDLSGNSSFDQQETQAAILMSCSLKNWKFKRPRRA